jgi:hypothetical protein
MDVNDLLIEALGRVDEHVEEIVEGLAPDDLTATVVPGSNSIGWLVWHLTRVQDHHVAGLLDDEQIWVAGSWGLKFGVDSDPDNTGYGHGPDDVAAIRPTDPAVLAEYYRAVSTRTMEMLRWARPVDLDRVVDEHWDPPVTLGVRLISVIDDDVQHAGQAKYLKGLLQQP